MTETRHITLKSDRKDLRDFLYNLSLIAPGKGEAKKTVSGGKILLVRSNEHLWGYATDDIVSVVCRISTTDTVFSETVGTILPDEAKDYSLKAPLEDSDHTFRIEVDTGYDYDFWWGHVNPSINGRPSYGHIVQPHLALSPDRLRKFGLLEPRGKYPLDLDRVEWEGNDIIRWMYGPNVKGVLAPLDRAKLAKNYEEEVLWNQNELS